MMWSRRRWRRGSSCWWSFFRGNLIAGCVEALFALNLPLLAILLLLLRVLLLVRLVEGVDNVEVAPCSNCHASVACVRCPTANATVVVIAGSAVANNVDVVLV